MKKREKVLRESQFALRITQRKEGKAAVVYRRRSDNEGRDRLQRLATISPLAFTAAASLLRDAVSKSRPEASGNSNHGGVINSIEHKPAEKVLITGPFHPLDPDWGARVACYGIIASGLRDGERLMRSADQIHRADATEAAWWLGLLARDDNQRAVRALRILTEAVE
jgi:hypothetical protein